MKEIIYNHTAVSAGRTIELTGLSEELTKDNILGIINKTTGDTLFSPIDYDNISSVSYSNGTLTITLSNDVTALAANDKVLIKCYTNNDGYAKQGSDDTATNTAIIAAITPIAATAAAYSEGKPQLAQAITAKGVTTQPTDSLAQMASNVWLISQDVLSGESVTGNAVFPQPYVWNLISEIYAHLRGEYPNMILAEFYKGYDTIPLSGADAYYTCDGDFYEYATTHEWHDEALGRSNRYIIYYFHDNYSNFNIPNTSICPRRMTILGKIGDISLSENGRIVNIYNCGEINSLQFGTYTNPWGVDVSIVGIREHTAGTLIGLDSNKRYVSNLIIGVKSVSGGDLVHMPNGTSTGNNLSSLSSINFPDTEEVTGGSLLMVGDSNTIPLGYIGVEKIKTININSASILYISRYSTSNVKTLNFASLESAYSTFGTIVEIKNLESIYFPVLEYSSWGRTYMKEISSANLSYIYLGYKTNDKTKSVMLWMECPNLTDIELKAGYCKSLDVSSATALTESNMYAHILQRLKQDEAGCGSGVTITLGQTNLAKLTSAESIALLDSLTNTYGYTFA